MRVIIMLRDAHSRSNTTLRANWFWRRIHLLRIYIFRIYSRNVHCPGHYIFWKLRFWFLSLRLCDFLFNVFRFQGKMGKTKWKINNLLHDILVSSWLKPTKNEVTKMEWNAHMLCKYRRCRKILWKCKCIK